MLVAHFLNVGHGDCTFIDLPGGHLMMIDINNSRSLPETDVEALAEHQGMTKGRFVTKALWEEKSWEERYRSLLVDPYDYYQSHFSGRSVFRYIQTHPDMDHMSGLHRFFWQEKVSLGNFWDVEHSKDFEKEDFEGSRYSYADWLTYSLLRVGVGPDNEKQKVIHNVRGDRGSYWIEDGIEVLSPTKDLIDDCDASEAFNNCSYVLKLTHAGRSIILPGDAEGPAWESMIDELGSDALECDVLKASHHGRDTGYHRDAVNAMDPDVVICSVGKKPETDASDKYTQQGATVFSTRYNGTIIVEIKDSGEIEVRNHLGEKISEL